MRTITMKPSKLPVAPTYRYHKRDGIRRTIITNIDKVAAAMNRDPGLIKRYLAFELDEICQLNKDHRMLAVTGTYEEAFLTDNLEGFMDAFVLCGNCMSHTTVFEVDEVKNRKYLSLACESCGMTSKINHRVVQDVLRDDTTLQLLNPFGMTADPQKQTGQENLSVIPVMIQTPNGDGAITSTGTAKDTDNESRNTNLPTNFDLAVARLINRLASETADDELLDDSYELLAKFELPLIDLLPLAWNATIQRSSNVRLAVQLYASTFRAIVDALVPYDASHLILGCIEYGYAINCPKDSLEKTLKCVPALLRALLDFGLLDADAIIEWHASKMRAVYHSGWYASGELGEGEREKRLAQLRATCEPFVLWLQRCEAEVEEMQKALKHEKQVVINGNVLIDEPGYVSIYDKRKPTLTIPKDETNEEEDEWVLVQTRH